MHYNFEQAFNCYQFKQKLDRLFFSVRVILVHDTDALIMCELPKLDVISVNNINLLL